MTQNPPTYVLPAYGNDVHYVRAGSGPPVVLLHGVLGSHRGGGAPPPSGCLCGSHTAPSPPYRRWPNQAGNPSGKCFTLSGPARGGRCFRDSGQADHELVPLMWLG